MNAESRDSEIKSKNRFNFSGFILLLLFLGIAIYLTIALGLNERYELDLKKARLRAELLLSERLLEEKKNAKLHEHLEQNRSEKDRIQADLDNTLDALTRHQVMLQSAQNSASHKTLSALQETIHALRTRLISDSVHSVRVRAEMDQTHIEALDSLEAANQRLLKTIRMLESRQIKGVSIYATKANGTVVAKASRARALNLELEVPENPPHIKFILIGPDSKEISLTSQNFSFQEQWETATEQPFFVSSEIASAPRTKILSAVYKPSLRMKPGKYIFSIFSSGSLISDVSIVLR